MATDPADGRRTVTQKLPELIEWYLSSREVELKFIPNERRMARLAPEFDFVYWMDDRRITERALAMTIQTELSRMNYEFSLGKIISGMTAIAWAHYVSKQEYPPWLRAEQQIDQKRPVGRPRIHPKKITLDELDTVNSPVEQDISI